MSYTVTINVLGPHSGPCRPPFVLDTPCQRPGFYTVAARSDNGTGSGANVCPEHLFPNIRHYLGLPESAGR
jgi:hypothetical protein